MELSIDALMYLLAIINNLSENFQIKFSGNVPTDHRIKSLFVKSGFYRFVKHSPSIPISTSSDTIQIVSGNNSDVKTAQKMSDFMSEKTGISAKKFNYLYVMMIEMMSNTYKHAYTDSNSPLSPSWYCFAEYNQHRNNVSFTFMDIGEGIPATVRKNFAEKIDFLKIKREDKYVISALNGEFRTSTSKEYRGKGLPRIRKFCAENKIQNMRIITNKADISVGQDSYESTELNIPLQGTLYYWQINLVDLQEE